MMKTIDCRARGEPLLARWVNGLLVGSLWLAVGATALAQPESVAGRKYVPFPIDPDFESLLNKRLHLEKQLEPLKDFIKQLADNPQKLNLDKIKGINFDDEVLKRAVQKWAESDPSLRKSLNDWVKNSAGKDFKEINELRTGLDSILNKAKKEPTTTDLPPAKEKQTSAAIPKKDAFTEAAARAMKNVENTNIGDWVRDSPAWNRAFEDLQKSMKNGTSGRRNWSEWTDKVRLPEGKLLEIGQSAFERLRNLPRPNMERWSGNWNVPSVDMFRPPQVSLPALPSVGSPALPTLEATGTWLLVLAAFLLVGWQLQRWTKRSSPTEDVLAKLGPWPVGPANVSTRAELVQAFDYLALLTLGTPARSWNHHAVAQRWSQQAPSRTKSATELANLYEQARYTDRTEELTLPEREKARRSLLLLAEAP